jgi:hypothetical protein
MVSWLCSWTVMRQSVIVWRMRKRRAVHLTVARKRKRERGGREG